MTYVSHCFAERTAATRSAGPVTHPIFQPVNENVLPADEIVSVRSPMPGSVQSGYVRSLEHEVLVHLVGDGEQVVLDAHRGDGVELADE